MTAPVAGPRRHHLFNRLHDGHAFEGFVEQAELDPAQLEQIGAPTRIRRITFVSVVLMASLVSIDLTIVNVALPAILGDLGGGVEAVQWVASIYSLTFAVCMIPAGRAGDVLGHRRLFLVGGLAYLVASLVAALAPTALVLVVGRAFQGVGAAMVSPAVIALTARVFSPERRHVAFGISAGALSAMAGLGPLVGGRSPTRWAGAGCSRSVSCSRRWPSWAC